MRPARRVAGALLVMVLLVASLGSSRSGVFGTIVATLGVGEKASASAASAGRIPAASIEPILGLPATGVTIIGASPLEAQEEAWAYGTIGNVPAIVNGKPYANQHVLLEHTDVSGWQVVPLPSRPTGEPLSPDVPSSVFPKALGAFGGRATAGGGVVLFTDGGIVTRDPGGQPQLVSGPSRESKPRVVPEPEALLSEHESVPPAPAPAGVTTPFTAIEDGGRTGILIAPYEDGAGGSKSTRSPGILHYDGVEWTREGIVVAPAQKTSFTPEAVTCGGTSSSTGTSSAASCWLLASFRAQGSTGAPNRLGLFKRVPRTPTTEDPSKYTWEETRVTADPQPLLGELGLSSREPLSITSLGSGAQMLTVTSQGVWVDFKATLGGGTITDVSKLVIPSSPTTMNSAGTWCYPLGAVCSQSHAQSLGATFPTQYQSFAWAGSGEDPGIRIVTGLPHGALLELSGGVFSHATGVGGNVSGAAGAAFASPGQGWIASGGTGASDQQGQSQVIDVTSHPSGDQLQETPVPFRYPLLAVTQAPGSTPGDTGATAVAVGMRGEIGRYIPAQGWQPESLYDSTGRAQTPTLRGVAWPQSGRAYAVGDSGAMWLWRADTGLWEPDPAKPLSFIGNLTGVAFSSVQPSLGYAVGKGGVLLRFGKSWTQVSPLPAELQHVNFTSVVFAGTEALATYRTVVGNGSVEAGGLAIEDGSGWHADPSAAGLLARLSPTSTVLSRVAGLPDGGAVAAGPGLVIERDSSTAAWRFSPQPLSEAQNVSALAAYRDGSGAVRAVVSVDLDGFLNPNGGGNLLTGPWSGDVPAPSGAGQPPPFAPPDPLPSTGYLLKESASGWSDIEHMALEAPSASQTNGEGASADMPIRPDSVLSLLVDPSGSTGLAVGGQTYNLTGSNNGSAIASSGAEFQTAAAIRFGVGRASVGGDVASAIATTTGHVSFVVGGEAACVRPCADFAGEGLAPDVSLTHALQSSSQIASSSPGGLRGFLYTGERLRSQPPCPGVEPACVEPFERELRRYESLLGSGGGSLPVYAAGSGDLAPGAIGIGPLAQAIVAPSDTQGPPGTAAHAFTSLGSGGSVRVIVLDYSGGALGQLQQDWLRAELKAAAAQSPSMPAIVMGNASLGFTLPDQTGNNPGPLLASDASTVSEILTQAGASASAYLFDYPGNNVQASISSGGRRIQAFGTGTLGYVSPPGPFVSDSLGSSGFLLLDINTALPAREPNNVAPVHPRVEPNISQLALNATDGVFLRRSHVALFEALARRPPSGVAISLNASGTVNLLGPEPYDPIPFNCQGNNCASALPTDYTFASSNPDIGDFVAHDPASANPRQALLGANRLPVPDPKSGLFCAFNSGTTTVSITTGGLTYSEPVTVQAGSVEYPCGTVPLKNPPLAELPAQASFTAPEPPLASAPPSASPQIQSVVPPPPPPPPPAPVHPKIHAPASPVLVLPFVPLVQPLAGARPAIVPPPAPPAARPIPPSGTSQVSQTVGAVEKEREEESATEIASSGRFAAYDANRSSGPGPWILVLAVLAAGAGVGIGRGRRSIPGERPALALAASRRRDS